MLVEGEMGAGKTTFVRGAARALGVTGRVTSPTFTLGRRHTGDGLFVSHLDLHRLPGMDDEDPALLDDYLTPDAVAFVEWPAVAAEQLPPVRARVLLEHAGQDARRITIELEACGA